MKIQQMIDLLQLDDFHKESERIDVAKGKYQIPRDWDAVKNLFKRM